MIGLCIHERKYIWGLFRLEWFSSEESLNQYLRSLDPSTTTWKLGEEPPLKPKPLLGLS